MKVLLIEGDADFRMVLSYGLRQRGFEVSTAGSGPPVAVACAQVRPAAVILSVGWSDAAGLDTLARLSAAGSPPILILTARNDRDHSAECLKLGAAEVLLKPFTLQHLTQRLRALTWRTRHCGDASPQRPPCAPTCRQCRKQA